MKISLLVTVILSTFILTNCADGSATRSAAKMEDSDVSNAGQETTQQEEARNYEERKLIKEGWVTFETDDIKTTRKQVFNAVNKYKGYVSKDNEYHSSGRISNDITIRVPAEHFDNLLKEATKGIDNFEDKTIEVKDVTEEFLDVQARLETKKELEKRYLKLVEKAGSIKEILEVEKELGELRGEIESIEGRLRYLKSRISLSTLHMSFYKRVEVRNNEESFGEKISDNFLQGWNGIVQFFIGIVKIWPLLIIGAIITFFVRRYIRKQKSK